MKKVLSLIVVLLSSISALLSIPAIPYPVTYEQPDGTTLTVYLCGDENRHYFVSEDNYPLLRNADNVFYYAQQNAAGELELTQTKAHNVQERTFAEKRVVETLSQGWQAPTNIVAKAQKTVSATNSYPLTGSPKSLVILVSFADKSFVVPDPKEAYTNLLNQKNYAANGATGSARDYFRACSNGLFSPDFVVVGPYTLSETMAYYGGNDASGSDLRPASMVVHACAAADADVDFSIYDTDGDGIIDNVFVYYAGHNEAEGASANTIWPHRWSIYPTGIYGSSGNYTGTIADVTFDNVRLTEYACTSELRGNIGSSMCGIGTFCHEFGHVLGLPDYYHTTNSSKSTLDYWDIMAAGAYLNNGRTPPLYNAYSRFYLNWLVPVEISSPDKLSLQVVSQDTVMANYTQAYLISQTTHNVNGANPNPSEFFILEHRKPIGWDAYLATSGLQTSGMLIWHVDYNSSAWKNNTVNNYSGSIQTESSHMRVYLQPTNGTMTTSPGGAFITGEFTPTLWSGTLLDRKIENITTDGDTVKFIFMGGAAVPSEIALVDENKKNLQINVVSSALGELELQIEKENAADVLYVYSTFGHLLFVVDNAYNQVTLPISSFKKGNVYIFKAGRRSAKWLY